MKEFIQELFEKVGEVSRKLFNDGCSSYSIYLEGEVELPEYGKANFQGTQRGSKSVKSTFILPEQRTMVIYDSNIIEKVFDNNSFEKHGGFKYIFEPMTNEIVKIVLNNERFKN